MSQEDEEESFYFDGFDDGFREGVFYGALVGFFVCALCVVMLIVTGGV